MESSSNAELNRTISAPVKHELEHEHAPKLKTFSSEKIPCPSPSSPTKSHDDQIPETSSSITTEAPVTQEMERSPSSYRIPASVFERNPSSSPMEWSTASNESLFSIHTGNMSFTNDQYCMWRPEELNPPAEASSGELDPVLEASASITGGGLSPPAESSSPSGQMFSYHDSAGGRGVDMRSHGTMGLAEATMLEVIKESESQNPAKSLAEVRKARRSGGSNTSNTSFAFSIMGGDPGSSTRLHGSIKSHHEKEQATSQAEAEAKAETPVEAGNQTSWLSCFSCCSVRK